MACAERRISHVGMVAAMLVVIIGVSCVYEVAAGTLRRATTPTSSPEVRVNGTPTSEVTSTTSRSPQTPCYLVALDPYQAGRVRDLVKAEGINLLEYILVFTNNTANPLKHNMKHVFKVVVVCNFYSYCVTLHYIIKLMIGPTLIVKNYVQ